MRKFDLIIVGLGLAGATLALQCLKRKKKFLVINNDGHNAASRVAAGLFNPFTGPGSVKTWMADEIFPYLSHFYLDAEKILGKRFYFPMPICKPFASIEEKNNWMAKSYDPIFEPYIDEFHTANALAHEVYDPIGSVVTSQGGYIDTQIFLDGVKAKLIQLNAYFSEDFSTTDLRIQENEISYKQYSARHVVFCEGIRSTSNSYFNWVPILPLKGEVLEIEMSAGSERIYSRGIYIIPIQAENKFRVGATYNRENVEPGISEEAKSELISRLQKLLTIEYRITHQDWGIRPTTSDRKPVLGSHPEHANLIMFNGLGTKGVSLAPYFSNVMAAWLDHENLLDREINISRF